mgnify:FL=1
MMKKLKTILACCSVFALTSISAMAMDSNTLQNNPARYRVVSTQPDGIVYMDMDSVQAMQTRDLPSSIENISCTLYVEKYAKKIDAMAFQKNQLISQISEYKADIHANKVKETYQMDADFQKAYTADGNALDEKKDTLHIKNMKAFYMYAHRLIALPAQGTTTTNQKPVSI